MHTHGPHRAAPGHGIQQPYGVLATNLSVGSPADASLDE
jgi:hypothetical protein